MPPVTAVIAPSGWESRSPTALCFGEGTPRSVAMEANSINSWIDNVHRTRLGVDVVSTAKSRLVCKFNSRYSVEDFTQAGAGLCTISQWVAVCTCAWTAS